MVHTTSGPVLTMPTANCSATAPSRHDVVSVHRQAHDPRQSGQRQRGEGQHGGPRPAARHVRLLIPRQAGASLNELDDLNAVLRVQRIESHVPA